MVMQTQVGASIFDVGMFKNFLQSMISTHIDDPSNVDDDGYPKTPPATNYFWTVVYPSTKQLSETWVIKGTGVCNLQLVTTGGYSSASVTQGASNCSILNSGSNLTVTCNANVAWRVQFQFAALQATSTFNFLTGASGFNGTLRGLMLCRSTDESAIDNATKPDDLWSDEFVAKMTVLKPAVWRPMGLTNPNGGNNAQYRYIPNWKTGLYLQTGHYRSGAYCGDTGVSTTTYTCNNQPDYDSSGVYKDGETITVKFVNASASALTINVGGRGAVPVLNAGGTAQSSMTANTIATMSYDSVLGGFIYASSILQGIIPYELLAGLCNRVGCDYWLTFQGQVDNASVTQIIQAVSSVLNSTRKLYVEYGNEVWNPGGSFPYTTIANSKGTALGFTSDNNRRVYGWYALRHRQIMELVTAAWSPRSTSQLVRVLAFQAFGPKNGTDTYRMQGADLASVANGGMGTATYVSYTGDANYRTVGNRPLDYSDAFSYATYFSGAQLANFDANYLSTQTEVVVNGATPANPCVLQTSSAHGYTTGQRVELGRRSPSGPGTSFTGAWAALNSQSGTVTVIDSTHFSVAIDASGFAAYSGNAGGVRRYANEMTGLIAAADNYATGTAANIASALDWVDNDVRQGTNYGSASTGGSANQTTTQLATLANGTGIYPQWDTLAVTYNKPVVLYEGGFEGWYPVTATMTALGYDSSYAGSTGKIANLINAYKNDRRYYTLVKDQMTQFFASSKSLVWAWLLLAGNNQWATMVGDMWTSTYASWDTMRLNNNGKRRIYW